jgi:predicted DNA-binding transcriptional regulator AlpA
MGPARDPQYVTRNDIKDFVGKSFYKVCYLPIMEGFPKPIIIGKRVYWMRAEVMKFLKKNNMLVK